MWYEKDFGPDVRSVLARVVQWLPVTAHVKDSLQKILRTGAEFAAADMETSGSAVQWSVTYNPYDWSHNST
jgi:hypothetical protein